VISIEAKKKKKVLNKSMKCLIFKLGSRDIFLLLDHSKNLMASLVKEGKFERDANAKLYILLITKKGS